MYTITVLVMTEIVLAHDQNMFVVIILGKERWKAEKTQTLVQ